MDNNQDYIVRCDRAGVFFGKIKARNGSEVTMTEVRKLWSWDGACAVPTPQFTHLGHSYLRTVARLDLAEKHACAVTANDVVLIVIHGENSS